MKMFRNKSFVSRGVHSECFYKLISAYPKATFKAGLADSESASTAVSPAGTSLPSILAAGSISAMSQSHQPHLERCEVAVGRKQGPDAGLTAPLEKALSQ